MGDDHPKWFESLDFSSLDSGLSFSPEHVFVWDLIYTTLSSLVCNFYHQRFLPPSLYTLVGSYPTYHHPFDGWKFPLSSEFKVPGMLSRSLSYTVVSLLISPHSHAGDRPDRGPIARLSCVTQAVKPVRLCEIVNSLVNSLTSLPYQEPSLFQPPGLFFHDRSASPEGLDHSDGAESSR